MKLCPECGADVEGLVHHCDCCGALLQEADRKKRLFSSMVYQIPACMDFPKVVGELLDAIEPQDISICEDFLERVEFDIYCYQRADWNLKNRVAYYPKRRQAIIRIVLETEDVVYADREEKRALAAKAISWGLHTLECRLEKHQHSMGDLLIDADAVLQQSGKE